MDVVTNETISTDWILPDEWSLLDIQKSEEMERVCKEFDLDLTDHQILINIDTQRLHLMHLGSCLRSYQISTAKNGAGQKEGTGQTPLGLHYIIEKIGDGAKPFEIFKSRVSIGEIAEPTVEGNAIVGRILWLQGVQSGFNQGCDLEGNIVDSHDRYIYIHGTNDITNIGMPVSVGCVRMHPDDVIDLFEKVPENTPVYIYKA